MCIFPLLPALVSRTLRTTLLHTSKCPVMRGREVCENAESLWLSEPYIVSIALCPLATFYPDPISSA